MPTPYKRWPKNANWAREDSIREARAIREEVKRLSKNELIPPSVARQLVEIHERAWNIETYLQRVAPAAENQTAPDGTETAR